MRLIQYIVFLSGLKCRAKVITNLSLAFPDMSRANTLELQLQELIFSINPLTAQPYPQNSFQVADGQGTRTWQNVFQTISSQSAASGVTGLGYLPSSFAQLYGAASSISTIVATSYSTLSTQIGSGGIPGSITSFQLQSTVSWIQGPSRYISTGDLTSTMTPFFTGSLSFMSNIQSTVNGLGSSRYISSPTLLSSCVGLNNQDRSTVTGLGTLGYISSLSLQSTVQNLGLASYISSLALQSSVTGILYPPSIPGGSLGVVVTGTTDPPFVNFTALISQYLTSTNYISQSNAAYYGVVLGNSLPSTTLGIVSSLGTYGYVSTPTLLSTSAGIQAAKQNIYIDNAGAMSIYGSQVYISTVGAITFLSSFVNSTLTYQGQNGPMTGSITNSSNFSFSSINLQFDKFSSLITSASRVTAEIYPTFQFDSITNGSVTSKSFLMSTCVQYGTRFLSTSHETQVAGIQSANGYSNFFQQPIKISIPGSYITGAYQNPYVLTHYMPGAISFNTNVGFRSGSMNTFFASTNSYFLTIQNLSF